MNKQTKHKYLKRHHFLIARFFSEECIREGYLEKLHQGICPSSNKKDFSDIKVVTPYGEIKWNEVSRISEREMRKLMVEIEKRIKIYLCGYESLKEEEKEELFKNLENRYSIGVSWDLDLSKHDESLQLRIKRNQKQPLK